MILCLTPNPAIDRTLYLDAIHLGKVHRTQKMLTAAGGKGLNVARTIHTLGGRISNFDRSCFETSGTREFGLHQREFAERLFAATV
ncbi:MAG TPA: hypothetical protein VMT73_07540 [Anaerolineales bacterium]|nr:hypothetical protein [Anaerolineales bacterium]